MAKIGLYMPYIDLNFVISIFVLAPYESNCDIIKAKMTIGLNLQIFLQVFDGVSKQTHTIIYFSMFGAPKTLLFISQLCRSLPRHSRL